MDAGGNRTFFLEEGGLLMFSRRIDVFVHACISDWSPRVCGQPSVLLDFYLRGEVLHFRENLIHTDVIVD